MTWTRVGALKAMRTKKKDGLKEANTKFARMFKSSVEYLADRDYDADGEENESIDIASTVNVDPGDQPL